MALQTHINDVMMKRYTKAKASQVKSILILLTLFVFASFISKGFPLCRVMIQLLVGLILGQSIRPTFLSCNDSLMRHMQRTYPQKFLYFNLLAMASQTIVTIIDFTLQAGGEGADAV